MLKLVKIFNKVYLWKYYFKFIPYVEVIFQSGEKFGKVIKTHGGFAVFTDKMIYKITHNKNINILYGNQNNFFNKSNQCLLLSHDIIYHSDSILIISESNLNHIITNDLNFDEVGI